MRSFRKLAVASTAGTIILIAIGGIVRATESGLGCPDWPKCHGRWIPPLEASAIIEYSHRLTAAVVGLLILTTAITAWNRFRASKAIFWPAFGALVVVIVQGGVGRFVVERELSSDLVALHFALSLTLLGLLVVLTANAFMPRSGSFGPAARLAALTAGSVAGVLMLGALVTQWNAALVFSDWPLMDGRVFPGGAEPAQLIHYLHRLAAGLLGVMVVIGSVSASRRRPRNRLVISLSHSALALWLGQVALGAANVFTQSAPWAVVLHVVLGALLWVTSVALVVVSYRTLHATTPTSLEKNVSRASAYLALTKPRIIELLLITTVPSMILAGGSWPPLGLLLATLVGGTLTAASANSINCYFDRDIDARMERTLGRPLPLQQIDPPRALIFGVLLGAAGFLLLWVAANPLAAVIALSAILFYVFIYTLWLKRTTTSNIVIGGAAGAAPVLVGWAAVTGSLSLEAVVLFAIVFYWTPPHFWALALRYRADYQRADVPMLPAVKGAEYTTRQMFAYAVALASVSLLLIPAGRVGFIYLISAVLLGAIFVGYTIWLRNDPSPVRAMAVFRTSILYLTCLFVAVAVDTLAGGPRIETASTPTLIAGASGFFLANLAIIFKPAAVAAPAPR